MSKQRQDEMTKEMQDWFKKSGAGASEIDTSWPDPHDFDKNPVLTGLVTDVETVTRLDRKPRRATVDTGDAEVSLWESASLGGFFDKLRVGNRVFVQFTGMKPLGDNKEQRMFKVAIAPGGKS